MNSEREVGSLDRFADKLRSVITPLSTFLVYVGASLAIAMALIVVIDILLRVSFNRHLVGVLELETFMLAVLCFLSLAYTLIQGGHVSVDIFVSGFSEKRRLFLTGVFSLLGMFIFIILSWQYIVRAKEAIHVGETSELLLWPKWPFFALAAFGLALVGFVFLGDFMKNHAKIRNVYTRPVWGTFVSAFIGLAIAFSPFLLRMSPVALKPGIVGLIMVLLMMLLLFLGFPVAFTMTLVGILGTWYLVGLDTCMGVIRMAVYDSVADYFFCTVPFFVLMGFLCLKAGIGKNLFETGLKWFGQMPGGLAVGTIAGCGAFASICGDSMATAATMGSVSIPEMKKHKYDDSLATGSVAAGGTIGILIPPSLGFIVYGIVTEESVGKLFMAGFIPGILLTMLFCVVVYIRCKLNPSLGPKGPKSSLKEKIVSIRNVWMVVVLFGLVIGGMYMGFFTSTEAGAVGAVGALLIAMTSKEFNRRQFLDALLSATKITAMVAAILIGVTVLGYFIALTEIPMQLAAFLTGLNVSRYVLLVLILILYVILGMLMNIIPMIMLTLPILFPTIVALGFDPIWFGVIMVIVMEMGQITPPVGINVFVIAGIARDVPMGTIFRGIWPFILAEIVMIIILTLFPGIALYLPNRMQVLAGIGS